MIEKKGRRLDALNLELKTISELNVFSRKSDHRKRKLDDVSCRSDAKKRGLE